MAIEQVEIREVSYKWCPADKRNIAFTRPDGSELSAFVLMDPSWDLSLFVETQYYRFFIIGVSPDKQRVRIERWLNGHAPTILEAATTAEQNTALNGKNATANTHEELVTEAVAGLTASDRPVAVPARAIDLAVITEGDPAGSGRAKKGDFVFGTIKNGEENVVRCWRDGIFSGVAMKTKGTDAQLVEAFRHRDERELFFLFDTGADYLLECVRFWGNRFERKEATAPKASVSGTHEEIVQTLAPTLAPDQG